MTKVNTPIDKNQLAWEMLQWMEMKEKYDGLKRAIETQVVQLGETMNVGYARCSYSKGRDTFEGWEDAVMNFAHYYSSIDDDELKDFLAELINEHTETETVEVVTTDWKAIIAELGIEREVVKFGFPKATLKVMVE